MSNTALRYNKNKFNKNKFDNNKCDNDNINLAEVQNLRKKGREFIHVLQEFFPQDMRFKYNYFPWTWGSYAQILWDDQRNCCSSVFEEGFNLLNKLDEIDNQQD